MKTPKPLIINEDMKTARYDGIEVLIAQHGCEKIEQLVEPDRRGSPGLYEVTLRVLASDIHFSTKGMSGPPPTHAQEAEDE